jgi:hypothetical protein
MTTLTQVHRQWASRPADQRFTSLTELQAFAALSRQTSRSKVVSTRELELFPAAEDHLGLLIGARDGTQAAPTHWSFGQLCSLASMPSPASYFRDSRLPSPDHCRLPRLQPALHPRGRRREAPGLGPGWRCRTPRRHRSPLRAHLKCRRG